MAFAIRPSGCYKGDQCTHCHFCTAEEAKKRRREIQVEFKEKKKQAWPLKKLLAALLSCEEKQLPARTSFWL